MRTVQSLHTPIFNGKTAEKPGVFKPVLFSGDDSISFKRTGKQTDAEKLVRVKQEAFELFSKNQTRDTLIQAVKEHFGESLAVFDGQEEEWVNDVCKTYNNVGFFHLPDSVMYENQDPKAPIQFEDKEGVYPRVYTKTVLPQLYRSQKPAIFISKTATPSILMHEIFHALQFKHGLQMGGKNQESDTQAKAFRDRLSQSSINVPVFSQITQACKRVFNWVVMIPVVLPLSKLSRLVSDVLNRETSQSKTETSGEALRHEMRREQEVDRFLIFNGKAFGLSLKDRLTHMGHYLFESTLQYMRSFFLD